MMVTSTAHVREVQHSEATSGVFSAGHGHGWPTFTALVGKMLFDSLSWACQIYQSHESQVCHCFSTCQIHGLQLSGAMFLEVLEISAPLSC